PTTRRDCAMSNVLVIAEHLDGALNASTARTVSAALALSPEAIDVAVLAADPSAVAAEAAKISGVTRVRAVANPANAHPIAQVLAPQVAELAKDYSHVFLPSTTFGKDLAPCVAALLGVAQVSDLMAVEGPHVFKRPIYAGNAIITVEAPADRVVVATVRTASWPEAARDGGAPVGAADTAATPTAPTCRAPGGWCRAVAAWGRRRTSTSSTSWPTSSARRWAPRARRSTPATSRTSCRSARPARSSPPSCTWRWASPARSST